MKPRAVSIPSLSPVSGNKKTFACPLINKNQAGEMPRRTTHAYAPFQRVATGDPLSFLRSTFKFQMLPLLWNNSPRAGNCSSHLFPQSIYLLPLHFSLYI